MNFQKYLNLNKKIAIYGCGQLSAMTIKLWPSEIPGPNIYVDKYKSGRFNKKKIVSLKEFKKNYSDHLLILASFKIDPAYVNKVFKSINQEIITVYDIFQEYIKNSFSNGWHSKLTTATKKKVLTVKKILNDKYSKKVFTDVIDWRYKRKLNNNYLKNIEKNKYRNFFKKEQNKKFNIIDCGQYDWSFFNDCKSKFKIDTFIGLEPSYKAFMIIKKQINFYKKRVQFIKIINQAISNKNKREIFLDNSLLSSRIVNIKNKNTKMIKSQTLENYYKLIKNKSLTTIVKLHIEGYENLVIDQSYKFLKKKNIILIINLSHNEKSLIETPIKLKEIGYKYFKFYNHSLFGEGLTLYASKNKNC